jgi:deoxyribose-phosphate aldolase
VQANSAYLLPQKIFSLLDLTSLNETDDQASIAVLCQKAINPSGHVAAVCVYPQFVKQAATFFSETKVKVATVVNFPQGNESLEQVNQAIQESIRNGADEIDLVFPYSRFLSGDKAGAFEFIQACKKSCENKTLKVILETGALKDPRLIEEVGRGVLNAGADFIKTSTGKISIGATTEAATVMLNVLKEMMPQLKRPIGFKVSGGVRTLEQAKVYIDLADQIMGVGWISPEHFRIGTSGLNDFR